MFKKKIKVFIISVLLIVAMTTTTVYASTTATFFLIQDGPSRGSTYADLYLAITTPSYIIYTIYDPDDPANATYMERLQAISNRFALLYAREVSDFGEPSDADNNDCITIVFHNCVDILGYCYNADYSYNNQDMIHINSDYMNPASGYSIDDCVSTLLHEIQHSIHDRIDANEDSYIQEMLSMFAEDYYLPGIEDSNLTVFLHCLNSNNTEYDIWNSTYYDLLFMSRYLYNQYSGLSTLLAIRDNPSNDYPSILETLGIAANSPDEIDFLYGLMDYSFDACLYNNAQTSIALSGNTSGTMNIKSRCPMIQYIQPGGTSVELTLASADSTVEYLVKEVSFSSLSPIVSDFEELATYRLPSGTTELLLSDADHYLLITPVYVNGENTTTWSYSAATVNFKPTAVNDSYTTYKSTSFSGDSILANDTDRDGIVSSSLLATNVSHGTLTLAPDGTFTYVPDDGFTGTDSFTYYAIDNDTDISLTSATVTITVNEPYNEVPVITLNGSASMTVSYQSVYTDPGATASDAEDGTLSVVVSGTVDTATAGTYTLTYTASDLNGQTASATRMVIVLAAPVISTGVITTTGQTDAGKEDAPSDDFTITVKDSGSDITIKSTERTENGYKVEFESKNVAGKVVIDTETVDVTFPAGILTGFDSVSLQVDVITDLTDAQKAVAGNAVVYDFTLFSTVGENSRQITAFSEPVTISIPYELAEGETSDYITVYYLTDDGSLVNMKGVYSDGFVTFETMHFSKYFIDENIVSFTDTTNEKILAIASKGIVSGKNGAFHPDQMLTRADLAKMLVNALNLTAEESEYVDFNDVSEDKWYYDYIMIARANGLVTGKKNEYKPYESVSFQDAMVMIARAMEAYQGVTSSTDKTTYTDTSSYANSSVTTLIDLGFIEEFNSGWVKITREQAAELIYAMFFYREASN